MAENDAGPMCLGGQEEERQLLPGSVPAIAAQAGGQKGDLRGRGVNAHGDLPHAYERNRLQGSRRRTLPAPLPRNPGPATRAADCQARLYLHHRSRTASGSSFYLDMLEFALMGLRAWTLLYRTMIRNAEVWTARCRRCPARSSSYERTVEGMASYTTTGDMTHARASTPLV